MTLSWFAAAMSPEQLLGIGLGLGIILLMLLLIFIKANLVICEPNEVVVISGRRRKLADGTIRGYRLLKGGRGFKWPILETVKRLPLTNISINLHIPNALCDGLIPIQVNGLANFKIAGDEESGLSEALERFLGKPLDEVGRVARETIDGNLRGVLAEVTPEEANQQRLALSERICDEARKDLRRLGLVLDFFKIQNIADNHGYLEAIGRKKNAQVRKEARIAEATAEADARSVSAEQKQRGRVAEAEADISIVDAENKLAVHQAELELKTNEAQERARLAGRHARILEEQKIEEARILRNQRREEANTIVSAEAQKRSAELEAQGRAAAILEDGKATAEAIELMRAQWEDGKTRELFLIRLLPELLDQVTRVVADNLHVEKLTVLDSGDGQGLPSYVKNLTGSAISIVEQLKNATGLDLPDLLQQAASQPSQSSNPAALPKEQL